ncbi:MAG: serine O-acetyltransferase [Candidatus Omnitrophica bacterium]|nr:serine O-acetyltransferase [Candidatus Omnitrophota bacterium]
MNLFSFIFGVFAFIIAVILWIAVFFKEEIASTREKDPASRGYFHIILCYPGLHALIAYRIAHALWYKKMYIVADFISKIARLFTGVEIHPGAMIGTGLFIDHGMGVVIGETTIIGEHVTLFQGVTLGGTGKETGKRHPTLGDNIVVGAGAKVLGNIIVGSNSYIGANAVVINSVPRNTTVVGVPGRVTRQDGNKIDLKLDHSRVLDPVMQNIQQLSKRLESLEKKKS